ASPYRYDNNTLPASPQFLWRETGPIGLYVERGYVYAQMDVRGCGKSGGEFPSAISSAVIGGIRTASSTASPPTASIRMSRPRSEPVVPATSDLRRFLARALRCRASAGNRGAALFDRRLGQDRSAHPRQYRRLPPRQGRKKA